MRHIKAIWKVVLSCGWLVWLLDVATKTWALARLEDGPEIKLLGNFLKLKLTKNPGAAFSLGESSTIFLSLFSVFVIFLIGYWTPKVTSKSWALVLGLALGGTLGNLTDRAFRGDGPFQGHVIDWISLPHWPIFNVADSAIVIAAVLAIFLAFKNVAPGVPRIKKSNLKDKS